VTVLGSETRPALIHRGWVASFAARAGEWSARPVRLWAETAARGVALFLGLFTVLDLVGELRTPGFDENVWWLDLRPVPATASAVLLALAGLVFIWWALRPAAPAWRRLVTAVAAAVLCAVAVKDGAAFYRVWAAGQIRPRLGVPLSFVLAALLVCIAWAVTRPAAARRARRTPLLVAAVVLLCGVLFPLLQQGFFGTTAYVRPAAVAVVFGAQVHSDGTPSLTLADRVRTAAQLYKDGLARRLLLSGAQGVGEPVNETAAMRSLAIGFGVPASAISVDPRGFNTEATVNDTVPLLRAAHAGAVAVVSDFFHLPRVKLAYQRAGYDVITVPSRGMHLPPPVVIAREVPAFWVDYLRAVLH
jgi:vancomycin permeability regulator SanA